MTQDPRTAQAGDVQLVICPESSGPDLEHSPWGNVQPEGSRGDREWRLETDHLDDGVVELAELIKRTVAGGDSPEAALRRVSRFAPQNTVDRARVLYERRVGRIRDLRDPYALVDAELRKGYWYPGPSDDDVYWPALRLELVNSGLGEAIRSVEDSSNRIVGLMRPPGTSSIDTRGLVLGYVQSGKTTNFMSVIAKAADVGYKLFVVLSGVTDNLRAQTQERLESSLVGDIRYRWFLLTDIDNDFLNPGNAANLLGPGDDRLLGVIKKNPSRLRRLLRWLDSAGPAVTQNCPMLIIDDEADQASVNVGTKNRTTRINGLIKQILEKPKAAYVAYTATPFANLLIDPSSPADLYPRHFIVELPRPDDYFGPEKIFGREPLTAEEAEDGLDGLDLVRHVPPEDVPRLLPPRTRAELDGWDAETTPSLEEAIRWFVLATAARRHRGTGNRHSTMLVHTSMMANAHFKLRDVLGSALDRLRAELSRRDESLLTSLETQWELETFRMPAAVFGRHKAAWGDVATHLEEVLSDLTIVVDNYMSTERLAYAKDGPPVTAIVIGGNTLSRGLTLEGLVCSFFVRAASAYDTLLQMGRWFGYREGYEDLVRIWMTEDLETWFFWLATVEEEIRREIRRYEELQQTPLDVPVRIRCHPAMAITSAAKMRAAVPSKISFDQDREQTILFNTDSAWLQTNLEATREMLRRLEAGGFRRQGGQHRPVFENVPADEVSAFLARYQFHPSAYRTRADLLLGYIAEQTAQGFLTRWSVVVMAHPDDTNGTVELGLDGPVNLIQRAQLDMPNIPHANIKSSCLHRRSAGGSPTGAGGSDEAVREQGRRQDACGLPGGPTRQGRALVRISDKEELAPSADGPRSP